MTALITLLAPERHSGAAAVQFVILLMVPVALYFLMIRPQRRRMRETAALQASLTVGDEVITNSGIYGFITAVEDDLFWLEVDEELKDTLLDCGFVEAGMPDMMWLRDIGWDDRDGYIASMKRRYRSDVRRDLVDRLQVVVAVLAELGRTRLGLALEDVGHRADSWATTIAVARPEPNAPSGTSGYLTRRSATRASSPRWPTTTRSTRILLKPSRRASRVQGCSTTTPPRRRTRTASSAVPRNPG